MNKEKLFVFEEKQYSLANIIFLFFHSCKEQKEKYSSKSVFCFWMRQICSFTEVQKKKLKLVNAVARGGMFSFSEIVIFQESIL